MLPTIIDIEWYDLGSRPYGILLPGRKTKVPVIIASTVSSLPDNHRGTPFFDNTCTDGCRPGYDHHSPYMAAQVPSRTSDGLGEKAGWSRTEKPFESSGNAMFANTRFLVNNAWVAKSGRSDEPSKTHVRDHVLNIYLHGIVSQHMNMGNNFHLLPESDPEFKFEFDYIWRVPRRSGDVRRVPLMAAEVEDMHMDIQEGDNDSDTIGIRVMTADGPLRFAVRAPKSSLPNLDVCGMEESLRRFYGPHAAFSNTLNRLCMTAIVHALMKHHGITRKAAFDFLHIRNFDVYPAPKEGFYTFDAPCADPSVVQGTDRIWDKRYYRLYGEPLFDGTATQEDLNRFKELTGTTMEFLQDVQEMFSLDEPLDSDIWYGGDKSILPDWHLSVHTCDILAQYLATQDGVPWDRSKLKGEDDVWKVDWNLKWEAWTKGRNNRTDFQLLKRLGIVPFLPRIAPEGRAFQNWQWLASYRRRIYPSCVVVWNKLETQEREVAKFAKMLGDDISPAELKKALAHDAIASKRPDTAVFLLGVMELTALPKADVEESIRDELGSYIYIPRN